MSFNWSLKIAIKVKIDHVIYFTDGNTNFQPTKFQIETNFTHSPHLRLRYFTSRKDNFTKECVYINHKSYHINSELYILEIYYTYSLSDIYMIIYSLSISHSYNITQTQYNRIKRKTILFIFMGANAQKIPLSGKHAVVNISKYSIKQTQSECAAFGVIIMTTNYKF